MFKTNTPFHSIYTSMTCLCAQCQTDKNAQTAYLPPTTKSYRNNTVGLMRLPSQNKTNGVMTLLSAYGRKDPKPKGDMIFQLVTATDSETGEKFIYCLPVR